jgi:hypothetical protein
MSQHTIDSENNSKPAPEALAPKRRSQAAKKANPARNPSTGQEGRLQTESRPRQ